MNFDILTYFEQFRERVAWLHNMCCEHCQDVHGLPEVWNDNEAVNKIDDLLQDRLCELEKWVDLLS